jgi:peptidoglycan hydrolase FlgJ
MVEVYNASTPPLVMPPLQPTGNGTKRGVVTPPLGVPRPLQTPVAPARANPNDPDAKARQAAQQFEAVFLNQLLQQLDKTIDRSESMLHGGHAEDTFRGMMMQEMATQMATRTGGSGLGLSDTIFRQIKQQQAESGGAVNLPAMPAPLPTQATGAALKKPVTGGATYAPY